MSSQHFLVPLDFSACAERALAHAIELATKLQARLTLLHVTYPPLGMGAHSAPSPAGIEADARPALDACLKRVHDAGVDGSSALVCGIPWWEIIEMADTQDMDLIIMGTHRQTDIEQLFSGSVAKLVVRLAPCPVLVTPCPTAIPTA
jgi:nucleotide-binding universal stress UspA family protein